MNKSQFRERLTKGTKSSKHYEHSDLASVTDPSFAQSGRDLVFNPKPYDTKPIYSSGVPADKMQAFDGMYKDKFEAFQAAKEFQSKTKKDFKTKVDEYTNETPEEAK